MLLEAAGLGSLRRAKELLIEEASVVEIDNLRDTTLIKQHEARISS
jgi:hypothetical protein